jgi:Crp-like helix-turn-helix domain
MPSASSRHRDPRAAAIEPTDDGRLAVPLTQEELAGLAGTSRATVNRVLREAERRGELELHRGKVVVIDPARFATLWLRSPLLAKGVSYLSAPKERHAVRACRQRPGPRASPFTQPGQRPPPRPYFGLDVCGRRHQPLGPYDVRACHRSVRCSRELTATPHVSRGLTRPQAPPLTHEAAADTGRRSRVTAPEIGGRWLGP